MKSISNILSNLLTLAFAVVFMPVFIFMSIFSPIMLLSSAFKIVSTGFTVNIAFISSAEISAIMMYISLRFRPCRRLYTIFPSLYETLKYLTIANIFMGVGGEILNWSYIELSSSRKMLGIGAFILSLILWRVFVSVYYAKKPISKVMLEKEEKLNNYSAA